MTSPIRPMGHLGGGWLAGSLADEGGSQEPAAFVDRESLIPPSGAKRPKEGTNVRGQCLRLLQGGEMPTAGHCRPALDVQPLLGHRAWWPYDLTWKGEISSGHFDARAGGHGPVSVPVRIVGPEGGINGAGGPVQHHRRQQFVPGKALLDFSTAVAPTPELLDDPGSQADGRVGESVCE